MTTDKDTKHTRNIDLTSNTDMYDAPLSDMLRQDIIKTDNQLIGLSDSSWQDCPDTGKSTGKYIIFYQGGTIDHVTHVQVPVSQ